MRISDWSSDVCSSDLEAELARSRAAAARGASGEANPQQVAEGLVAVIERTEHGEAVIFTVDIDPALRLPIEDSDLAEMLGALVENAARHARRQVRIAGRRDGEDVVDRKRVVYGNSVSGRVSLCGPPIIKKKTIFN